MSHYTTLQKLRSQQPVPLADVLKVESDLRERTVLINFVGLAALIVFALASTYLDNPASHIYASQTTAIIHLVTAILVLISIAVEECDIKRQRAILNERHRMVVTV